MGLIVGAAGVALSGATPAPEVHAAAGDPFDPADAVVFVAQNGPTQLFKAIPDAGGVVSFQAEGGARAFNYNAIGYNPANNYLYGIKTSTAGGGNNWPQGAIVRIGQSGVATRVGTGTAVSSHIGAFGDDGFYYVSNGQSGVVQRINPANGNVTDSYAVPATVSFADFTWAHGYFWTVNNNGDPVRLELNSPTVTVTTFPGALGIGTGGYGALWTFGNGNIGVSRNGDGRVFQISIDDATSAAPSFTVVSNTPGPASGLNDGAASSGQPTDIGVTKDAPATFTPGSPITYTLTVTNHGPGNASGYTVSDSVPAELMNVQTATPGCTVVGNDVTCAGGRILNGDSATITITADTPAGSPICIDNTVTVLANEEDPNPANDSSTAQTCAEPALTIAKSSSTGLIDSEGQIVPFTFAVTNIGAYEISGITVADANVAPVTCVLTTLAAGESTSCTGTYTVTLDDLDAGSIINTATVEGIGPDGPLPPSASNTVTVPAAQNPQLELTKVADVAILPEAGEDVTYTFSVTNTGNVTVSNPSISDPMVDLSGCTLPVFLEPGDSADCTGTHTVTQPEFDAGELSNTASVVGDGPGGPLPATPSNMVTINASQEPELTVVKSTTTTEVPAAVGDEVPYLIQVTNTGNVTINNIEVTDPLITPVNCGATVLEPGEQVDCTGTYYVTAGDINDGFITNTASATGDDPSGDPIPPAPSNEVTVEVAQDPELMIVKSTETIEVDTLNENIIYRLVVTNTGNTDLGDIVVSDPTADSIDCPGLTPSTVLPPGALLNCTAEHSVTQSDLDAGEIVNTATALGRIGQVTVWSPSNEVRVPVTQFASLEIVKSADPVSVDTVGQTVAYTFVVTNTGNVTIDGVAVNDPVIGAVTCPTGPVAPGDSVTCDGSRNASPGDFDNGTVINVATSIGLPPGATVPLPPTPSNTVTITANQTPELSIVKMADVSTVEAPGDEINYTLEVSNTGNVTVHSIIVSDPMLTDLDCPSTSLDFNTSMICTGSYSVTADDLDTGLIANTANVSGTGPDGPIPPIPSQPVIVEANQTPGLSIVKSTDTDDVAAIGEEIAYRFLITNTGNVTVSGIAVVDPLVDLVSCPSLTLAMGEDMTCTATYVVTAADLDAGSIVNTATLSGDGPNWPIDPQTSNTVTVEVDQQPGLSIVKSSQTSSVAAIGATVEFEFAVTNIGNVTMSDIAVTDPLIASIDCPETVLAAGASMTCTGEYTVTADDAAAGEFTNTASVSGSDPSGAQTPPTGSNEVRVAVAIPTTTMPDAVEPTSTTTTTSTTQPLTPGPLPSTGSDTVAMLPIVLLLIGSGAALVAITRRRSTI